MTQLAHPLRLVMFGVDFWMLECPIRGLSLVVALIKAVHRSSHVSADLSH
jgi:hypothetical protein